MLRARCALAADIQGIQRAVGASRSALDASFWRTFEMTPSAYHARVRLTHGLSGLRDPLTKAEEAARLAGFASVKNFSRAERRAPRKGLNSTDPVSTTAPRRQASIIFC
jgi:methylphosphotriester-DNA--protein-cysteine methyltransferase